MHSLARSLIHSLSSSWPGPTDKDTSTRFNATIPLASGDGGMSQEHQGGTSNIDGTSRVPLDVFAEVG